MNNDMILDSKKAWRDREAQAIRSIRRTLDHTPLVPENQADSAVKLLISVFVCAVIFAFCCIQGCDEAHAAEIDMKKIAVIESSGNPLAHNKKDDSRGLYQITPICLKEYNSFNKTKYSMDELWNVSINTKIALWYMSKRIPQLLAHFGLKDTIENRIICWNAGIGNLLKNRIPKTTQDYLKKYGV